MTEDEKKNFKTTDRRSFSSDGKIKPDKPEAEESEKGNAGVKSESLKERPTGKVEDTDSSREYANIPKIDFTTFILSLHTSTLINLGAVNDPTGQNLEVNLELARQNIDMIEMIKEKTKGNLDENESNILENSLYDLRMRYIDERKKQANK